MCAVPPSRSAPPPIRPAPRPHPPCGTPVRHHAPRTQTRTPPSAAQAPRAPNAPRRGHSPQPRRPVRRRQHLPRRPARRCPPPHRPMVQGPTGHSANARAPSFRHHSRPPPSVARLETVAHPTPRHRRPPPAVQPPNAATPPPAPASGTPRPALRWNRAAARFRCFSDHRTHLAHSRPCRPPQSRSPSGAQASSPAPSRLARPRAPLRDAHDGIARPSPQHPSGGR